MSAWTRIPPWWAAFISSFLVMPALASAGSSPFIDPTDGAFDTSEWLLERRGFLPTPIIVTEPAVGYGGGMALLFFHESLEQAEKHREAEHEGDSRQRRALPPSVSMVFGMGTESRTWAAGGGHFGSWKDDSIRYRGVAGYADLNLDVFRGDVAIPFELRGFLVLQDLRFRIARSDFFLGARAVYSRSDLKLDQSVVPPDLLDALSTNTFNGGVVGVYDTRDNILSPNRGSLVEGAIDLVWTDYGTSRFFQRYQLKAYSYLPVHERFVLGLRLAGTATSGTPPFYALPYVEMRGVRALRYQNQYVGEIEAEGRFDVTRRWSVLGFVGYGFSLGDRTEDQHVVAGGGGFRYLIARELGLRTGIDVAGSKDQAAFYIQVGSAWR